MIKASEQQIFLLDERGERQEFDALELRQLLFGCFLAAGRRESCYLAEDIALAVEYAFLHSGRDSLVFALAELNSAVVRILEDTGLPEVAALYRHRSPARIQLECRVDEETVAGILGRFLTGSEDRLKALAGRVTQSLHSLRIDRAAPALLVELARHYAGAEAESQTLEIVAPAEAGEPLSILAVPEIIEAMPSEVRMLFHDGVIRVSEISRLFPSVRIFCFLEHYAGREKLDSPVTEMLLEPKLFALGEVLECCRATMLRLYRRRTGQAEAELPLYLDLPDLPDFVERYLGVTSAAGKRRLGRELAEILISPLQQTVEKLQFPAGE